MPADNSSATKLMVSATGKNAAVHWRIKLGKIYLPEN
jgi:hypothetical protein